MATHIVEVGIFGNRSGPLGSWSCKEHRAALRNPKSRLNCRCLLGVGGFAVILPRSSPEQRRSAPAHGAEVCACVSVRTGLRTYVEKRICFSWNASPVCSGETQRLEEQKDSARLLCQDECKP